MAGVIHLGIASVTALAWAMIPLSIAVLPGAATPGINVLSMTIRSAGAVAWSALRSYSILLRNASSTDGSAI